MNASEPKNDVERLARMKDARAQEEAALNARRADHKAAPRKAGEPGDHYRLQVTPEDIAAIKWRTLKPPKPGTKRTSWAASPKRKSGRRTHTGWQGSAPSQALRKSR